jgi:hypothetical protein
MVTVTNQRHSPCDDCSQDSHHLHTSLQKGAIAKISANFQFKSIRHKSLSDQYALLKKDGNFEKSATRGKRRLPLLYSLLFQNFHTKSYSIFDIKKFTYNNPINLNWNVIYDCSYRNSI